MGFFYPVSISPSRYGGTYEGGPFVIIAGVANPRKDTLAFGGDTDCMGFWRDIDNETGSLVRANDTTVYAYAGDSPEDCHETFHEFKDEFYTEQVSDEIELQRRLFEQKYTQFNSSNPSHVVYLTCQVYFSITYDLSPVRVRSYVFTGLQDKLDVKLKDTFTQDRFIEANQKYSELGGEQFDSIRRNIEMHVE